MLAIITILITIGIIIGFILLVKKQDSQLQIQQTESKSIVTQDPVPLPSPPISPSVTKKFGPENPLI